MSGCGKRPGCGALAGLAALLLASSTAGADDGRIEINQVCAVQTGCRAGDAPGFPVTLGTGSYLLTGSLSVTDPDVDAIEVLANTVAIDLNGFAIAGPVSCSGSPDSLSCAPAGTGRGIAAATRSDIVVMDGHVSGFASEGVRTGSRAQLRELIVRSNGGSGLRVGMHSVVTDSIVLNNALNGVETLGLSLVLRSVAEGNGVDGIQTDSGSTIRRSTAWSNGDDGIHTGSSCAVSESVAYGNFGSGIEAGAGSRIDASVSDRNFGSAVTAGPGSAIQSSTAGARIAGFALDLAADATFRETTVRGIAPAGTVNGGLDLGANACNGSGGCP